MDKIRFVSISDIHLGHRRTTSPEIIKSLRYCFKENDIYNKIDLLVIAGDVFDRLLELNHPHLFDIDQWIAEVLIECGKRNIVVIVLDGTKSHDRDQSERWITINHLLNDVCKLYYFNTVAINYIPELDIQVLSVPDDWNIDSQITFEEVKQLLKDKSLSQVDLSIMHGQFEHQLPEVAQSSVTHRNQDYLDITKHYILVGHIHKHSVYERILAQGSIDRLAHGEEEPKGFIYGEIYPNNPNQDWFSFIMNPLAKKFITIDCKDKTLEESILFIKDSIKDLKDGEYVRIEAHKDHPVFSNMDVIMELSPLLKWSKLIKELEIDTLKIQHKDPLSEWTPIKVDQHNIIDIVKKELTDLLIDPISMESILNVIKKIK